MGSKTIGLREDAYDRLKARKRPDESFTDVINRLLNETEPDWRDGFGSLSAGDATELERIVEESRAGLSVGLGERHSEALAELSTGGDDGDEAP